MISQSGFTLDHIGIAVPNLDTARDTYARLGFTVTSKSSHRRDLPNGEYEPLGTGNYCIMLNQGYVELIGITDPTLPHESLARRLDRYHGIQLVAVGTEDAAGVSQRWSKITQGVEPLANLGRAVPLAGGEGTLPASFKIVYLSQKAFQEVELFAIEHVTPDALWQPALLTHRNTASSLRATTIVSAEPDATLERLDRLGLPASQDTPGSAQCAAGCRIDIVAPDRASRRFPGLSLPGVPSAIAMEIGVSSLATLRAVLSDGDVPFSDGEGRVRVPAEHAAGAVIDFVID